MRGQAAIEFVILTGFMTLVFTTFFLVVEERTSIKNQQGLQKELVTVADIVEQEVALAHSVREGYNRTFELPRHLNGEEYTIQLYPPDAPSEILITAGESQYVFFLQTNLTTGSEIAPGYNEIVKMETNISINPTHRPDPEPECCNSEDCGTPGECREFECHNSCTLDANCEQVLSPPDTVCGTGFCNELGVCQTCKADETNIGYNAGGTVLWGANSGKDWDEYVQITSHPIMNQCCSRTNACAALNWCPPLGHIIQSGPSSRLWACQDVGSGPAHFQCTSENDGVLLNDDQQYCCSKFSSDPDGAEPRVAGDYGFGYWNDPSKEEICGDESDNDCDTKIDCGDDECKSDPSCLVYVELSSTCTSNSTYEDLTATAVLAIAKNNNVTYDWRVGNSITIANFNFDFDNSAGAGLTKDYSSYSNHGTLKGGVVWQKQSGFGSGGYFFDGQDDWIGGPDAAITGVTDSFTIEMWVSPFDDIALYSEKNTGTQGVTGQKYAIYPVFGGGMGNDIAHVGAGVSVGKNGVQVFEHKGGHLPPMLVYPNPGLDWEGNSEIAGTVDLSGWHHIVVVYNNKIPSLYIDGNYIKRGIESGLTVHPSNDIGEGKNKPAGWYGHYNGKINEVRIYNRALGEEQILQLFLKNKNIIDWETTTVGENWSVCVTNNNGAVDDETVCSNGVEIVTGPASCDDVCDAGYTNARFSAGATQTTWGPSGTTVRYQHPGNSELCCDSQAQCTRAGQGSCRNIGQLHSGGRRLCEDKSANSKEPTLYLCNAAHDFFNTGGQYLNIAGRKYCCSMSTDGSGLWKFNRTGAPSYKNEADACNDGYDNDCDMKVDCNDPDCSSDGGCCTGCSISGTCYPNGADNPANDCQVCDTGRSTAGWSNKANFASCDDGWFCNGADQCLNGQCNQNAGNPCTGSSRPICLESQDRCVQCTWNGHCPVTPAECRLYQCSIFGCLDYLPGGQQECRFNTCRASGTESCWGGFSPNPPGGVGAWCDVNKGGCCGQNTFPCPASPP